MFIWPEEFKRTRAPNGTISELLEIFDQAPFLADPDIQAISARLRGPVERSGDRKW